MARRSRKAEAGEAVQENEAAVQENEKSYLKDSVLRFKRFERYRDLLAAVLEEDKRYTVSEVEEVLKVQGV